MLPGSFHRNFDDGFFRSSAGSAWRLPKCEIHFSTIPLTTASYKKTNAPRTTSPPYAVHTFHIRHGNPKPNPRSGRLRLPILPEPPPALRDPGASMTPSRSGSSCEETIRRPGLSWTNSFGRPTKLLVNVTVERSLGPIHVLISPENTVAELIRAAVEMYVREARRPLLALTDPKGFELHYSKYSLESLDPQEKVVNLGSRNFFVCSRISKAKAVGGDRFKREEGQDAVAVDVPTLQ